MSEVHDEIDALPTPTDVTDARFSTFGAVGGGGDSGAEPMDITTSDEKEDSRFVYSMNHARRGYAVIMNNKKFEPHTRMGERNGTDLDAANLYHRLKALGFKVDLYNNTSAKDMVKLMKAKGAVDHSDCDCFVTAILSHGDEGVIYGTDGIVAIDDLVSPFKGDKCPSLAGKPKIFFLQACRGDKLDHGAEVPCSDARPVERIPAEADILMAYSVVPGFFSWRNSSKGSWFIQALCRVLEQYGDSKEIMWIMTRVNRMVAYDFESNAAKAFMNQKKQIPCITSMLTKELFFKPKKV